MLTVNRKIVAVNKPEGDGAEVNRLFPTGHFSHLDPFVLMDEFMVEAPSQFDEHEHRGFEAITYMLSGSFVHEDNLGNKSKVEAGGLQHFNAGRSIRHSEAPGEEEGHSHGIQLWINLPRDKKDSEPVYHKLPAEEIPVQDDGELSVRTVAGPGSRLPLQTEIIFQDVSMTENTSYNVQLDSDSQAVIYMLEGELEVEDEKLTPAQGYLLASGARLSLISLSQKARFIFLSGSPLGQDINIRGSFVE